jgi:hypothetical protein
LDGTGDPLAAERELLRTLLREAITNATLELLIADVQEVGPRCTAWAQRSLCHCLSVAAGPPPLPDAQDTIIARMRLNGPAPALGDADGELAICEADTPLESWGLALQEVLQRWV